MQIGLIGCGNMARALARGWGRPLLCADPLAERAAALAAEVGGEALPSNAEVAARADLLVLCHKPAQLAAVARAKSGAAARRSPRSSRRRRWRRCARPTPAGRSTASSRRCPSRCARARSCRPRGRARPRAAARTAPPPTRGRGLFAELGTLVVLDDALVDVAMGLMSCAPAYVALVAEAQIDAGVRRGIPAAQGAELVVQTLAGTAELLRRRDYDTIAVRREVASPGGFTARGLDALERAGLRAAFSDALDAVLAERP